DRYDDAIKAGDELLALRKKVQGMDHWQVASLKADIAKFRKIKDLPDADRAGWQQAAVDLAKADNLATRGKYAEATPLYHKVLEICRKVLGDEHPDAAQSFNNVARNLDAQGKHAEAAPFIQKALDIWRKVLGDEHTYTATAYNNLAANLIGQGKYAEATPL